MAVRFKRLSLYSTWWMVLVPTACMDFSIKGQSGSSLGGDSSADTSAPDSASLQDSAVPEDTGTVEESVPEPDIAVDPTSVDAGEYQTGETVSATVVIGNEGDAPLTLDSLTSGWGMAINLDGTVLDPGATVALELSTVAIVGDQEDALVVESDDPDEPSVLVPLAYSGFEPCSWDGWIPDDSTTGGWGGTMVDGEVELGGDLLVTSTDLIDDVNGTILGVQSVDGFVVDDEVFIWGLDGTYAFSRVVGILSDALEVSDTVTFENGARVIRVAHYTNVTVTDAATAGVLLFRACGDVMLEAGLSVTGGGHEGGQETTAIPEEGWQGASEAGAGTQSRYANGTGGGGGEESCNVHADGGGGGHATEGEQGGDWTDYSCGGDGGEGGTTIGDSTLATLHFGGGGGSGYLDDDAGGASYGGAGGAGGGLIRIVATGAIQGTATISADGAGGVDGYWATSGSSPGGGGGGAGGTIWLVGDVTADLSAIGGAGGEGSEAGGSVTNGGTGGEGRIRIDGTFSGIADPAPYEAR